MSYKFIYLILGLTILLQLGFSFYFSNEIINQNQEYQNNSDKMVQLNQEIEVLENKFTDLTSLANLSKDASGSALVSIKQVINLTQK